MAKEPGNICNPLEAAALMAIYDEKPHLPIDLTRRPDGVLVTVFDPTPEFLEDCRLYRLDKLPVLPKKYLRIRSRLLDMKDDTRAVSLSELLRTVQA